MNIQTSEGYKIAMCEVQLSTLALYSVALPNSDHCRVPSEWWHRQLTGHSTGSQRQTRLQSSACKFHCWGGNNKTTVHHVRLTANIRKAVADSLGAVTGNRFMTSPLILKHNSKYDYRSHIHLTTGDIIVTRQWLTEIFKESAHTSQSHTSRRRRKNCSTFTGDWSKIFWCAVSCRL
jgi:hypothetical protein